MMSILNFIQALDLLLIVLWLGFIINGLRIGIFNNVLYIAFSIIAIGGANYSLNLLESLNLLDKFIFWIVLDISIVLIIWFLLIWLLLLLFKRILIFAIDQLNQIKHPCWLNGLVFWILALLIFYFVLSLSEVAEYFKTYFAIDILQQQNTYILIWIIYLGIMLLIIRAFNIPIFRQNKCWLMNVYNRLLMRIQYLGNLIHYEYILSWQKVLVIMLLASLHLLFLVIIVVRLTPTLVANSNFLPYLTFLI